ncbi:hypothetical protein [Paraburkholderia sacchari]|uniref:hypothetical protein n=1 Tax=Paraburkholderia sacchari TaxID=159450 RepID=UPI000A45E163
MTIVEDGNARQAHLTDLIGPCFTTLHFSDDGHVLGRWQATAAADVAAAIHSALQK